MDQFFQTGPELANSFESDLILQSYVRRKFPERLRPELEADYRRLGQRAVTDILALGKAAEKNPPVHVPYDPWGRRIDQIEVSDAWTALDRVSAEEGIVATGYERKHGSFSRVDQFIRLYLFHPSSAIYSCPLAMSDGAARLIEVYGDEELKNNAYRRLTTRNPSLFWTSGQWMTERTGGSDVSGSETVARLENGTYRLYGTKWFTSATTSQMAMTLARIEGEPKLSLFYVELRDPEGRLRNIQVNRLKDKLGTRALPTAELKLQGTPARLIGGAGDGVKKIATLFNITRIYNSCCATGYMARGLALARDYARKRYAFGKPLSEQPLHLETLAALETEVQAAFLLTFRVVELLGKEELGEATPVETAILRLLTPVAKLYTAKQAVALASEVLECFGGAGYIEDTGLPALLRDSQVLSIWEGTTNVLSLDTLRAIEREKALSPLLQDVSSRLQSIQNPELVPAAKRVAAAVKQIEEYAKRSAGESTEFQQAGARAFAFAVARTAAASLLLEHAEWSVAHEKRRRFVHAAIRWCEGELVSLKFATPEHVAASRELALS